jgi:transposase
MSPSYISGISKEFPDAKITFDRFHVMKAMNEGLNEVRIQEQKKQGTQKYQIHMDYKQGKSN